MSFGSYVLKDRRCTAYAEASSFQEAFPGSLAHCRYVIPDPQAEIGSALEAGITTDTYYYKQKTFLFRVIIAKVADLRPNLKLSFCLVHHLQPVTNVM